MKTTYSLVAAVLGAGLLASCVQPYATETGGTMMRTSGAYSASHRGAGSTFHSRDRRDPTGDWRHDDERYEDDEDDDDDVAGYQRGYIQTGPQYTSYRTWRPDMGPAELPPGSRRVTIGGTVYYQYGNTWYRPAGSGFAVVRSPY